MKSIFLILALSAVVTAQDTPPVSNAQVPNAAVSGIVRDKGTGMPLANYTVSTYVGATWVANTIVMSSKSKEVSSTTDVSGRYRLSDLPAAPYRINARNSHGGMSSTAKHVVMNGHDLDDLNFDIVTDGSIKGRVTDDNKEPIPGVTVILVSREYFMGAPGYFFRSASRPTNDRGEYLIDAIPAGQPFFLMAEVRKRQLPAHSETPLNAKLRRSVPMRTWYLNSSSRDGAVPVIVRPGEVREAVNIEMKKSANYCAEGTLLTGSGGPGVLNFNLEAQQPSSGVHEGGGMFMVSGFGATGSDGAFRFCDLNPGSYRLEVQSLKGDLQFGVDVINITDEDVKGLKVSALPAVPVSGEVVLDGPVPAVPLATKVNVSLVPLLRSQRQGERSNGGRFDIPGTFSFPGVLPDDYMVRVFVNSPGLYVKDVLWNGIGNFHQPLHLGAAGAGSGLRVIMGQDGATFNAVVTGKDSNPAPDIRIVAFPAELGSEGTLAATMISGQTDQTGKFTSQALAPGKYYVGAVDASIDYTSQVIERLWLSKNRFKEVDLSPNGNPQVNLEPVLLAPL